MSSGTGAMKMPWSVKGVDVQARDAAKEAARRAGMTLGEWLNTVIAEEAAGPAAPARSGRKGHDLRELAERLARLDRAAADTAVAAQTAQTDLESVLRRAIADTSRRANAVEERTAGALDAMVRWMERADEKRREEVGLIAAAQERTSTALRDALSLVTSRMDSMERTLAEGGDAGLRAAVVRLEKRIDVLDAREAAGAVPPRIEASLRDLEQRLVAVAERFDSRGPVRGEQADRIATIETALSAILERLDMASDEEPATPDAYPAVPGNLDEAMAQIRARQAELEGRPRRAPQSAPADALVASLKGDIAQLSARIDDLRRASATWAAAGEHRERADVATLRGDLADLTTAVKALAPQSRLDAIEHNLTGLAAGIEALRASLPARQDTGPFDALRAEITTMGEALAPLRSLSDLRADIAALDRRLDRAQASDEPTAIAAISDEIAGLKAGVAEAAGGVAAVGQLERRLDSLGETIEQLLTRRESEGTAALQAVAQDIRDALAGMAAPDLTAVESRLKSIEERVSQPAAPAAVADTSALEGLIRGLGEKIEAAGRPEASPSHFDALERQLAAMTEALGRNDESLTALQSMERSITELFARIEETRAATVSVAAEAAETAASRVAESVLTLPERDDRTGEAMDAVQATLGRIVERLARLENTIETRRDGEETLVLSQPVAPAPAGPSVAEKIAAAAAAARAARDSEPPARPATRLQSSVPPAATVEAPRVEAVPPAPVGAAAAAQAAEPAESSADPEEEARQLVAAARASAELALEVLAVEQAQSMAVASAIASVPPALSGDLDDRPLEPGTGRPVPIQAELPAEEPAVEPEPARNSFIAAARAAMAKPSGKSARAKAVAADAGTLAADAVAPSSGGALAALRATIERRRRPILLGLAVVVLAVGTAHVVRNMLVPKAPVLEGVPTAPAEPPRQDPPSTGAIPPADPKTPLPLAVPSEAPAGSFSRDVPATPPTDGFAPSRKAEPDTVGALGSQPVLPPVPSLTDPVPAGGSQLGDVARAMLPPGLQKAASAGNPAAAYEVGMRMIDGRGLPKDPAQGARWLEKAASAGLAPAEYRLGSLYEKGTGVPVDLAKAREWYARAAGKGNAKAMHNLGVLIADGGGDKPDYASAVAWFRRAAELGVRDSQYNLAILAARGLGMSQNLGESYVWFSIAATQGDEDAARKRDEVGARLDAAALATAKATAAGFQPRKQDAAANDVAMPANWEDVVPAKEGKKARS
ncbi:SEL1-like repeat protein [Alsobacter sp. R-9]